MSEKEKIENEDIKEENLDESSAGDTLKPGGGSGGNEGGFARASKSELLSKLTGVAGAMKKADLSAFLQKTLDQIGKEDEGAPNAAASNKASVSTSGVHAPSPIVAKAVKEDMDELLKDSEELSEDFRARAAQIFESAVDSRVQIEIQRLQEEHDTKVDEAITEALDELQETIDKYTDYCSKQWMEKNTLALEASYRAEATEKFIAGMKALFAENYIEVPEERLDVIGELETRVNDLEEELNNEKAKNIDNEKIIQDAKMEVAFDEVAEGLADTEVEKLRSLSEGIEFDNSDDYTEKLKAVRDQYFKEEKKDESTGIINEENLAVNEDNDDTETVVIPEEMKSYVSAISRTTVR